MAKDQIMNPSKKLCENNEIDYKFSENWEIPKYERKKSLFYRYFLWFLLIISLLGSAYTLIPSSSKEPIYIAMAIPKTGSSMSAGQSHIQGVQLYIDQQNKKGGINGRKIILDIFDDQNKAEKAKEAANNIINSEKPYLAIIGHNHTECSIAGGELYKTAQIPVITPSSTDPRVTYNNDWYFSTIFNNTLQGQFLATYVKKVLDYKKVTVIYEDNNYGQYLATTFKTRAKKIGLNVQYFKGIQAATLDEDIESIIKKLKRIKNKGAIYLPTHAKVGADLVHYIRMAGIKNTIIGPTSFDTKTFRNKFLDFPEEKINNGYYTDGIYVAAPLLFDIADKDVQEFSKEYTHHYNVDPDWHAAYSYDAAKILLTAIEKVEIPEQINLHANIKTYREKIRDSLASFKSIDSAVDGITGFNYFNEEGVPSKSLTMGIYKNAKLISAPTQLQLISTTKINSDQDELFFINGHYVRDISSQTKPDELIIADGQYMHKTNIAYVGTNIIQIDNLNLEKMTFDLEFHLWFKYKKGIDINEITNIKFINSIAPIKLGEPIKHTYHDKLEYVLYRVKGQFKADFLPNYYVFDHHQVGFSFKHKELNRNKLIYVKDILGMELKDTNWITDFQIRQVLSSASNWIINKIIFFPDVLTDYGSLGDPKILNTGNNQVDYSRFNAVMLIAKNELSLNKSIPENFKRHASAIIFINSILLFITILLINFDFIRGYLIYFIWPITITLAFTLLLFSEVLLINMLMEYGKISYVRHLEKLFDILWWLVPAAFIDFTIKLLLFSPLEKNTQRPIPQVLVNSISFIIYLIACFGIIAFVYNYKITSLLATSSVLAMIIGLAVKMNLAHIFSGIALNLERPFRIGDWVKIGDFEEGKVTDINWRATKIYSRNRNILSIPNSVVAESLIVNFNYPNDLYKIISTIYIESQHDPKEIEQILLSSVEDIDNILLSPAPKVYIVELDKSLIKYNIICFSDNYQERCQIETNIQHKIWKVLKFLKDIEVSFENTTPDKEKTDKDIDID